MSIQRLVRCVAGTDTVGALGEYLHSLGRIAFVGFRASGQIQEAAQQAVDKALG